MGKMAPVAVGADPVLDEVPARPTRTVACPGPTVRLRQAGVGWHNSTEFSIFGRLIGFFCHASEMLETELQQKVLHKENEVA